jgi:diaminohydroxyphosphoribosylaminopyrimidine deaminase/5-amino-6-(5-phosphoribosylamino)uracil reductase
VGAVLVKAGRVIAEGWHAQLGAPHAEAMALSKAGAVARGATLYVTLEPCAHVGRTPPCTDAIIAAGVKRCVVAVRDPHAIVNGRGLRKLRAAGVRVEVGMCADEARETLASYLRVHEHGLPRVTWKVAATLDGRIADAQGQSRWITGPEARRVGHVLRATSDAVVIGAGTARADDPRLTARGIKDIAQPLRVVCDSALKLPLTLKVFSRALAAGTVVACSSNAMRKRIEALEARGVHVWKLPLVQGRVSTLALAKRLAREGRHEVLIEGGAALGASWMAAGLVQRLALFSAPRVLGAGLSWCAPFGATLATAPAGRVLSVTRVGADTLTWVAFDEGGR